MNNKRITEVNIGKNSIINDFVNLYGCEIGNDCMIGTFVEIQKNVKIGNNVKIESHSFVPTGVLIEDDVFIGHHVVFVNDKYPRATNLKGKPKKDGDWHLQTTIVKKGASIGSNATILGGIVIGENSMIGAGSVVIKNVPSGKTYAGNPAKEIRKKIL